MGARRKTLLACGALLAAVALVAVRTRSVLSDPEHYVKAEYGLRDFRDAVYYPARALLDGVNPYDTESFSAHYPVRHFPLYSPATAVLYLPLALLPFEVAQVVYFALCVVLAVAVAWLVRRASGARDTAHGALLLAAGILLSRPGQQNVMNGQSTLQAVLGVLLALEFARTRPSLAAVGVVLGTLKPTFGLPLLLVLTVRRDFAALGRGVLVSALFVLPPLVAFAVYSGGPTELGEVLAANLGWHGAHEDTNLESSYSRVDAVMLVSRATGWIPAMSGQLAVGSVLLAIGLVAVARASARERDDERGAAGLSGVLGCLTILAFFYHQSYDLQLLFLPATALVTARREPWRGLGARPRALLLACVSLPLVNFAATSSGIRLLDLGEGAWRALTLFNACAVGLALAVTVVLAWRPQRTSPGEPASAARRAR